MDGPNVLLRFPGLESRTTNAFRWALLSRARAAGLEPDYISAVMHLESGYRPNIQNLQGAPALGLVQFWRDFFPSVAKKAGQPKAKWNSLRTSTALQQIPFVVANFTGKGLGADSTPTDYYMANLMPAFVGKPPDFELGALDSPEVLPGTGLSKGAVFRENAGLDRDGDGTITVSDVGALMENAVAAAQSRPPVEVHPVRLKIPPLNAKPPGRSSVGVAYLFVAGILLGGAYAWTAHKTK